MRRLQDFNKTVSEIVRADYRTADVFKKHGINYCCTGNVQLREACRLKSLDYSDLVEELGLATRNIHLSTNLQFSQWKMDFLIEYIINVHHAYLKLTLPHLETSLLLFIEGHRKKYPELEEVLDIFHELSGLLELHLLHEEEIIFPYIKQIENTYRRKEVYGHLFVRTLRKPLSNIEKEHSIISGMLMRIQEITNDYHFPSDACTNHQVIYRKLREFHDDMAQHKHLENNVLFPRAIEMEKELLER
ncbi:MAG: DUF542 domain-containing protein [Flavisolibacter sp.]|jgi:regulator of cell morphogenesis and NO signaling